MMRITCPFCGPRHEGEFRFGGEAHVQRPGPAPQVSDEAWGQYLHFQHNLRGVHAEQWCHADGCEQWFHLLRDTATHALLGVNRIGQSRP